MACRRRVESRAGLLDFHTEIYRIRQRLDDLLARRQAGMVPHVLGPGLARHRHLAAVEHIVINHELDDTRGPSNILHVLHDVLAARFQVGQEGRLVRDSLKII